MNLEIAQQAKKLAFFILASSTRFAKYHFYITIFFKELCMIETSLFTSQYLSSFGKIVAIISFRLQSIRGLFIVSQSPRFLII